MTTINWREVYSSLQFIPSWGQPVPTPTDAMLDAYEARSRFLLPRSYRAFLKVFGPGELASVFSIRAPGYALDGEKYVNTPSPATCTNVERYRNHVRVYNENTDLDTFNDHLRKPGKTLDPDYAEEYFAPDAERVPRIVCFATNVQGDCYGWDALDLREPDGREYGIYVLCRDNEHIVQKASSFTQFVLNVCLGYPDKLPRQFQPAGIACGMAPWIFGNPYRAIPISPAWLTTTVRGLARNIFEYHAFDRLPILADALEDAGCDNVDLLGHFRSGQQHGYGCWRIDLILGKK